MKKLSEQQRRFLKRQAERGNSISASSAGQRFVKRHAEEIKYAHEHHAFLSRTGLASQGHFNVPARTLRRVPILVPEVLSLKNNFDETIDCLEILRRSVLQENRSVMLYFDRVQVLEPAATLLLTAEIYRCRNLRAARTGHMVNGTFPDNKSTFLQLREMGFYRLIDVDDEFESQGPEDPDRPFFVPFRTFNSVNPEFAAAFCGLVTDSAFPMTDLALGRMVGALKEAMGNAEEHAYKIRPELPTMGGRWWVLGFIDPKTHEMMIIFCDQGIGIPRTLGIDLYDRITALRSLKLHPSDSNMIAAATELHRTSTGLSGRGKGFRDMKKFVDTCEDGELRILSSRGSYIYSKQKEQVLEYDQSIGGTLIEWRIRNPAIVEVEGA